MHSKSVYPESMKAVSNDDVMIWGLSFPTGSPKYPLRINLHHTLSLSFHSPNNQLGVSCLLSLLLVPYPPVTG